MALSPLNKLKVTRRKANLGLLLVCYGENGDKRTHFFSTWDIRSIIILEDMKVLDFELFSCT